MRENKSYRNGHYQHSERILAEPGTEPGASCSQVLYTTDSAKRVFLRKYQHVKDGPSVNLTTTLVFGDFVLPNEITSAIFVAFVEDNVTMSLIRYFESHAEGNRPC